MPPAKCSWNQDLPKLAQGGGRRTLVLDTVTLRMLAAMASGSASQYLFTGRTGQPMRPDNLTDRFNQLAVAAKVRPLGPHQIRHMLASNLLDTGYGVHEVVERLGHDPATLMRYYARVGATRRRQAGDRIAELVTAPERTVGRTDSSTVSPSTVVPVDGQEEP